MVEEMDIGGCKSVEEVSVMEVSNSHGGVRRSRDTDVTSSAAGKRRRIDSRDQENVFQLEYESRRGRNVVSTAVSGTSDHVFPFVCSDEDESSLDLEAEQHVETENFRSRMSDGFSREATPSSVICLESEEMESLSTSTPKKKKPAGPHEATSRCKPSAASKAPSAAEIDAFFSEVEKYEQKRFAEKYNFDIVKDVPMEGRYQWVRLKP